jgi:tetratricopeptide (TPR) repeat protein
MIRVGYMWLLAFMLVGCVTTGNERVHDYNGDGVFLYHQGNYSGAREAFQAAQALKPEDPNIYYNLGQCYDHMGETAKAERDYQECLSRAPNHADCRHALGAMLVRVGRRDDAFIMVQDWLVRETKRAAAYAEDGWLLYQVGDLPGAQARLQQALDLDPHEPRALVELARVYEAMQRPDRAAALYERVLERDPKQFELVKRLNQFKSQGAGQPHPDG